MGGVVSAIHKGVVFNIKKDFIIQKKGNIKPSEKTELTENEIGNQSFKQKDLTLFSSIQQKTKSKKQINAKKKQLKREKSVNEIQKRNERNKNSNDNPEDFLHDFFSSINERVDSSDNAEIKDTEGLEYDGDYKDDDDPYLPIINLLPRLTQDLETIQRRPNSAWFKKNYTNNKTIEKIYQSKEKYSPIKR